MSLRSSIPVLLLLAIITAFQPVPCGHARPIEKWVVLKDCSLRVSGSTNINRFTCAARYHADPDTLVFYGNDRSACVPMSGSLSLPVFSFDCMNNAMTADLRKTLKAKDFPNLHIYFVSLRKYPELKTAEETIDGTVYIELAGVSKKFNVNYRISKDEQQVIHMTGIQQIHFSDFALTPPRKLSGMVRARDQLDVEFYLNFRAAGY